MQIKKLPLICISVTLKKLFIALINKAYMCNLFPVTQSRKYFEINLLLILNKSTSKYLKEIQKS